MHLLIGEKCSTYRKIFSHGKNNTSLFLPSFDCVIYVFRVTLTRIHGTMV